MPISKFIAMLKSDIKPVFHGTHRGYSILYTEEQWKQAIACFQVESDLVFDYINLTVKLKGI